MIRQPTLLERASDVPLVWFSILTSDGTASDPVGREGLTRHAFELLRRGTKHRARQVIDARLDALGASLEPLVTRDWAGLSGLTMSDSIDEVFSLGIEMLSQPSFDASEHGKLVTELRNDLSELRDDDHALVMRYFWRAVHPGHPYARTTLGTEATLSTLDVDSARHHASDLLREPLLVAFAGDIDDGQAERLATSLGSSGSVASAPEHPVPEREAGSRTIVVDKPNRKQAQICMGIPAPEYHGDALPSLLLTETAFGGVFNSRLNQELRVKRGWTYGAGARFGKGRVPGFFRISFASSSEVAVAAAERARDMLIELCEKGLTQDELDFARDYTLGSLPFQRATARRRLQQAIEGRMYQLPDDHHQRIETRLATIGLDEINAVIRNHLDPTQLTTVMVCTADELRPDIEAAMGPSETQSYDEY